MGECYYGEVTLIIPDTIPNPFTADFDPDKFDTETFVNNLPKFRDLEELIDELAVEYDRIHELIDELTGWAIDCEQINVQDNEVTFGGEHNYGIAFWTENSELERVCQANGIAYHLQDEGRYEIEGEARSWRPGLENMLHRSVLAGGAIALNKETAQNMWDRTDGIDGRLVAFARSVLSYFEISDAPPLEDDREP